jgi:hypothetical protein
MSNAFNGLRVEAQQLVRSRLIAGYRAQQITRVFWLEARSTQQVQSEEVRSQIAATAAPACRLSAEQSLQAEH